MCARVCRDKNQQKDDDDNDPTHPIAPLWRRAGGMRPTHPQPTARSRGKPAVVVISTRDFRDLDLRVSASTGVSTGWGARKRLLGEWLFHHTHKLVYVCECDWSEGWAPEGPDYVRPYDAATIKTFHFYSKAV